MQPDVRYFLSSLDSSRLEAVRECVLVKKLRFDTGKACALARLDPPVCGQEFGLAEDVAIVVLAARLEGGTLFPLSEFPCSVFVARPSNAGIERCARISQGDLEVIGIGELYRSRDDAEGKVFDPA